MSPVLPASRLATPDLVALLEHVAALAALSTAAPVATLDCPALGSTSTPRVHHGPAFADDAGPEGGSPRLADGTRLVFRHAEPLFAMDGRSLGELTLYDVLPRGLSAPQQQVLTRLGRQAAALVALLATDANAVADAPTSPPPSPAFGAPPAHDPRAEFALDAAPTPFLWLDPQGTIVRCNAAARSALADAPGDESAPEGAHLWEMLPEAKGGPLHAACIRVQSGGRTETVEDWFPLRSRRCRTSVRREGPGLLLVVEDVTDARALEASLQATQAQFRAVSQRLRSAQEDERRRISRELHDVVGQDLSVIKLRLEVLKKRLSRSRTGLAQIDLCQDIIHDTENALAAARRLAQDMRPSILDQLGLNAAVEWQAQELQRRTGILCHVQAETPDVRDSTGRDTTAFRVLQELLTNVVRHAEASRVDIRLVEDKGALLLEVHDDGCGFTESQVDCDPATPHSTLGLLGVRERVDALGGNIEIETSQGHGTRVRVTLPPPPMETSE